MMMNKNYFRLLSGATALLLSTGALAQVQISQLYFDTRASFHQEVADGNYHSQFTGDHFNLNIRGSLGDKLDFRVRQRLNKKVFDERNMFNATDFLYLKWHATPKLSLTVGKNALFIGGYEFDAVPIDVYYYSNFCNNLYQGFSFGVDAGYEFLPGQTLAFQVEHALERQFRGRRIPPHHQLPRRG